MAGQYIKNIDDSTFAQTIAQGVTLVDFYADWCGPCKMLSPVLEKVAEEVHGSAVIAKVDVDSSPQAPSKFGVTSIPTLILFKDGVEVGRQVGLKDAAALKQFIASAS